MFLFSNIFKETKKVKLSQSLSVLPPVNMSPAVVGEHHLIGSFLCYISTHCLSYDFNIKKK